MKTRRAAFIAFVVLQALITSASAQLPRRVWRVGFLVSRSKPVSLDADYHGGFPAGMRDLGYVEGRDVVIEWRYADGRYERFPDLLADLIRIPVDVIVTDGTPSTLAARKATSTIPIVFGSAGDPVGNGLVASLAHPGGNATGLSLLTLDVSAKQIEMLRNIVPGLARIAIILNPDNPFSKRAMSEYRAAASAGGVQILSLDVRNDDEIEAAFRTMDREHTGAFIYISDSFLYERRALLARLAALNHLPSMGSGRWFPEDGGLLGYGPNQRDTYYRAASYVDRILKGANPGDLPVEQPMKLELVINRKTAKALGLTIPPELLLLADKVIE